MTEPEQYNEYGEIIEQIPPRTYERRLTAHDNHRIHETKDLFDSNCSYCRTYAKKLQSYWDDSGDYDLHLE